jgi:inosine/xanthosine triphosphatase
MKRIGIASSNPVKIAAALEGFKQMFPDESFESISIDARPGVSQQPMSDDETLRGAEQRAKIAREMRPDLDYWAGIEGGCADWPVGMGAFAWVVVLDDRRCGRGRSGEFFLPEKVAALVRNGVELGEADDRVFSRNNSKQGNGAIGLLTDDVIDRKSLYIPAVVFALIPFKNPELYP